MRGWRAYVVGGRHRLVTDDGKTCRVCGTPVTQQRTTETVRLAAALDPREYPVDAPLVWGCPVHGLRSWWQIRFGEETAWIPPTSAS